KGEFHVTRAVRRVRLLLVAIVEDVSAGDIERKVLRELIIERSIEPELLVVVVPTRRTEDRRGRRREAALADQIPFSRERNRAAVEHEAPVDVLRRKIPQVRLLGAERPDERGIRKGAE